MPAAESGRLRFYTIEELKNYLDKMGNGIFQFRAYPISGDAEEFYYEGREKAVTRLKDKRVFDNIEDFVGYCFQCDSEGYAHTEHIDVETIK